MQTKLTSFFKYSKNIQAEQLQVIENKKSKISPNLNVFFDAKISNENNIQIQDKIVYVDQGELEEIIEKISYGKANIDIYKRANILALELIKTPNFDRELVNTLFNGLGVEYQNVDGVAGIYGKRQATLQQYFTPNSVSKMITKLLQINGSATVLDYTCGSGRMFYYLSNLKLATGIELEEKAYSIAKSMYPKSVIINDDALNHVFNSNFDYCLLNPPFNMQWYSKKCINIGYKGAILSHLAILELGIRAVKPNGYIAIILPSVTFELDSTIKFHKWLLNNCREVVRIALHPQIFLTANYPSSLFIFKKTTRELGYNSLKIESDPSNDIGNSILDQLRDWEGYKDILEYAESRKSLIPVIITRQKTPSHIKKSHNNNLPISTSEDQVLVHHNGNSLVLRPNSVITELKIKNVFARLNPSKWSREEKRYISEISRIKDLSEIWSTDRNLDSHPIIRQLKCLNVKATYSPSLIKYIERKRRWYKHQIAPFEQWVKKDQETDWKEYFVEDGIRKVLPIDYQIKKKEMESLERSYPFISKLFDYQKDDIIRLSLKNSAIDASEMGLGKTRKALTLILLRNLRHSLIILPRRLVREWKNEINKLNKETGFENKIQYRIIENEEDINNLSKINIISYYTLCQKRLKSNKNKVFADKLHRRFKFIIADEAHNFSNSTTIRTKNVKRLKAKYWLFLTGTPIGNVVANFWSLCDIIFGGNTALFPYTTSEFRKQFVTVEWVTRQYDDTLAKGRTSQRLPKIKNLDEFNDMTKYMILRRTKEEPVVEKDVKIVKPMLKIKEFSADQEHWRVYKKYLDEFAELFRKYLHPELYEHERVKASVVLAQMQNLQFVSTMPQHPKFSKFDEGFRYKLDFTIIQKELLNIIKENYKTEKIILISQRPDFCNFLNKELDKVGISSGVFTGNITIDKRNKFLDKFDQNVLRILLCSINVIKEGINLPTGTLVLIVDLDWTFQKLTQAYSRVLRPETKESPAIHILYYKGFIDDYLWQQIRAKKSAVLSSIDRRTDIEDIEWVHWKDMTYKMLKELGYNLD